jgi:hypothetical protein
MDAAKRHSVAGAVADTISVVTTREIAKRLLDELPESEMEPVVEFIVSRREGKRVVDEWGDLDRFSARASLGVLRHLDEEEAKVGFSWEKYRRS